MLVSDILKRKDGRVVAVGAKTPLATAAGTMQGGSTKRCRRTRCSRISRAGAARPTSVRSGQE